VLVIIVIIPFPRVHHMKIRIRSVISTALLSFGFGCSSAPAVAPVAASPSPEPAESKPKTQAAVATTQKPASHDKSTTKAAPEPPPASEPAPTQGDGLRKASRPPIDLLTNSNATYMLNFSESEVGKTAKEECEASSDDRGEVSACLQKARAKIPIESLRFIKKGGEYWWITLNRYKGNLMKWHIIQFQVGEEKTDWVALKPVGKDKGIAPMARIPRTLEIDLPNDFSIVMKDPEFGKLTFDAKIGLFDD
jgi:hypothetical protein